MTIGEKVSYIKGLADGLALDESTKEGKIIAAMLDVLSDIAENLREVDDELNDIADVMTDMEESVADLEDIVYDIDDDDDDYDDEFEDDLDEMYEITCSSCGNTICVDYEQAVSSLNCPNCGQRIKCEPVDEDDED